VSPKRIVPTGPDPDFKIPHDREKLPGARRRHWRRRRRRTTDGATVAFRDRPHAVRSTRNRS